MRRQLTVTISAEGRDKGRSYLITEMPADQAERWGLRAINLMAKNMGGFSQDLIESGIAGLTAAAISAFVRSDYEKIEPLMDEMMSCIKHVPDASRPDVTVSIGNHNIEEVQTRVKLREEVLGLHLNFFKPAMDLISMAVRTRYKHLRDQQVASSSDTQTSPLT